MTAKKKEKKKKSIKVKAKGEMVMKTDKEIAEQVYRWYLIGATLLSVLQALAHLDYI